MTDQDKQARLAAALRENLKKRKAGANPATAATGQAEEKGPGTPS